MLLACCVVSSHAVIVTLTDIYKRFIASNCKDNAAIILAAINIAALAFVIILFLDAKKLLREIMTMMMIKTGDNVDDKLPCCSFLNFFFLIHSYESLAPRCKSFYLINLHLY